MLVDHIQKSVLIEEKSKKCECECCIFKKAEYIYLLKQGFCTVLSHVCKQCKNELENDCLEREMKFQFLSK